MGGKGRVRWRLLIFGAGRKPEPRNPSFALSELDNNTPQTSTALVWTTTRNLVQVGSTQHQNGPGL